jgi:uncharacterized Zn-finger protein
MATFRPAQFEEYASEEGVICPYCKEIHTESYEFFPDSTEDTEIECCNCSKSFRASQRITIEYISRREIQP